MRDTLVLDRYPCTFHDLNKACQWVKEQVLKGHTDIQVCPDEKVFLLTASGNSHPDSTTKSNTP